jgi:(p)ppGpp synthase/HD superfamily hydrolase
MWPLPPEAFDEPVAHALALAYTAHGDRIRVKHVIEVGHMLFESVCDPHALAAGLLHDAIADGGLTGGEIADAVGAPVATVVEALTERKDIREYERRKLERRVRVAGAGRRATAVYGADRLATLRSLRTAYAVRGEAAAKRLDGSLDEMVCQLHRDARMLKRVDARNPFLPDLMAEAAAFRSDRAASRSRNSDESHPGH